MINHIKAALFNLGAQCSRAKGIARIDSDPVEIINEKKQYQEFHGQSMISLHDAERMVEAFRNGDFEAAVDKFRADAEAIESDDVKRRESARMRALFIDKLDGDEREMAEWDGKARGPMNTGDRHEDDMGLDELSEIFAGQGAHEEQIEEAKGEEDKPMPKLPDSAPKPSRFNISKCTMEICEQHGACRDCPCHPTDDVPAEPKVTIKDKPADPPVDQPKQPVVEARINKEARLENMIGLTMTKVENVNDEELVFHSADGQEFMLFHNQDCCEIVEIEDITGELETLVGNPITIASCSSQEDPMADDSGTWTFYKFGTNQGWVDVRWYGQSNGYYSEEVSFKRLAPADEAPTPPPEEPKESLKQAKSRMADEAASSLSKSMRKPEPGEHTVKVGNTDVVVPEGKPELEAKVRGWYTGSLGADTDHDGVPCSFTCPANVDQPCAECGRQWPCKNIHSSKGGDYFERKGESKEVLSEEDEKLKDTLTNNGGV